MSEKLSVYTFGGLSIHKDGEPIPALHSRKAQALLVYLAVTGRPQPREVLADLLWEDFSQQKAMNNLRVVLSNLRKHLGDYLLITRETVSINPEMAYDLDVVALDANIDFAGDYERKAGNLNQEAITRIEQVVDLYQGEFLSGFFVEQASEFESWMVVERERIHHLVLDGLGKLVRWKLEQGEYTSGIGYTSRWMQLDPLSETAHRGMMQLLAFSGQRGEALKQYQRCQEILLDELGVEPDIKTTALYEQIRDGDFVPDETIIPPISTVKPVQSEARHHNLPAQTTPFIGRERELAELIKLLIDPDVRLVTVLGAGGMGKTRLALEAGEGTLDQFPDGVIFVSLARLGSEELIVPSIIQAMGIEFVGADKGGSDSQTDLKESLLKNLRHKQVLLILDNFEHLLDGANLVGEIVQTAPEIKVLATSRARLNVGGESRFQVAGMSYPEDLGDQEAQKYSAVRLFIETARRARSDFKLQQDDLTHIAQICHMVEGMPLGIRLAAAWVEMLSPEEIAAEIAQSLDLLETDLIDVPERQRSIRALYDYSWSVLSERERNVFQAFSVFRGGCTLEAARHVTGATLRDLRGLVDKSVLQRALNGRYEIHELSREYAAGKLDANLELSEVVHSRHSAYYCNAVGSWGNDLKSKRQEIALAVMDLEIENARVAWSWAVESHKSDLLNQSIEGLWRYFDIRMRWQEGERIFHHAAESLSSATSGDELRVYARMLSLQGNFSHGDERKRELYQQSMEVVNQLELSGQELPNEKAWVSYLMGELASKSDFEESVRLYKQSLHLFEKLGNCYWISETLYGLGVTYYLWGKLDDSLNYQQQSLVNFRKLGDPRKIAHILGQFTYIYLRQGEFEKAERAARERLEIYEMIGDPSAIAFGQGELGGCYRHLGKFEAAKTLLENAVKVFKELEHISAFFSNTAMLGFVQLDLGDYAQANDLAQAALAWSGGRVFPLPGWPNFRDTEMRRMGITFTIQGMASFAMGNLSDAEHYLQRSFDVLSEIQPITQTTYHHPILGIVSLNLNKPDQAKEHIWDGLNIGMQINSAMVHLNTLGAAALYLAEKGDLERAVDIYALASRYPEIAKSQWQKDVVEGPLTKLVASLPSDVVAQAQQRGRERDLVETVQELLAQFA